MLLGGDELGHTQKGNNNTYCQDNELTWLDWELDERQQKFLEFVKKVVRVWWRRSRCSSGASSSRGGRFAGSDIKDISFLNPSGQEMTDEDWNAGFIKCIGVRLAGDLIDDEDERGEPIVGDTLLLLLNAHHEPIPFTLPPTKADHTGSRSWTRPKPRTKAGRLRGGRAVSAQGPLAGRAPHCASPRRRGWPCPPPRPRPCARRLVRSRYRPVEGRPRQAGG